VSDTLDQAALTALLEAVGDDSEFVGELVDTYLADAPVLLAAMRAAIEAGSGADLLRPAHTLKGNSLNLGAQELAEISRSLEQAAKGDDLADAPARLDDAEAEYGRVVEALAVAREREWRP
jgi:HPt (histidine-containing phosphotransfer) domain-containing protein